VEAWEEEGIPYGFKDLIRIAKEYNCPLPKRHIDGTLVFEPEAVARYIEVKIQISPTGVTFSD
jgi:hypothetical protein